MIYLIGIVITFFLAFILLTKKGKNISDKILLAWLIVILAHLILFSILSSKQYLIFPFLLGLEIPIPLLYGPILFLYTKSLTKGWNSSRFKIFHFIPFLIALLSIFPFFMIKNEDKIITYQHQGEGYNGTIETIFFGTIVSGILYSILSLKCLIRHKKDIKDNYSSIEKINLKWLFSLIIGLTCIWIVALFSNDEMVYTAVVILVLFIGYYGIKQVGVFTNQSDDHQLSSSFVETDVELFFKSESEHLKYERSYVSEELINDIHQKMLLLMKTKKLFLIPELTLAALAQELNVHANTLSQVINSKEQKNFFDYINSLRVEEFKKRLAMPENLKYKFLTIALGCGFNSKTSFNRNFKSITGKSPSAYLKENKITPNE